MKNELRPFSTLQRAQTRQKLETEEFDLLVVGGGATGCGIALDAAARGLKTALVEKGDFASGTSSKSTKLIHGGLRYLKQLDIALVRETGTERAIVHRLAPHLVLPEKMLMPLIEGGTYGKWSTSFGLMVYDMLAQVEKQDRRKMLTKEEALELEPLLHAEGLKGGGYYAEYRTDDARLTIELIKTAGHYGALAINYCPAVDFLYDEDRIVGVTAEDYLARDHFKIRAKRVVSAAGPWVDRLRNKDGSLSGKRLHLTKGVHLVFDHAKFPLRQTTYFDAPDGRMIFAIPRGRVTYVGTTDTNYSGNLDRVVATHDDAQYLIDVVHHAFPSIKLKMEDIQSNWAGLRPLIHEDGKSPSELSRKDEIFVSPQGLISIAGGKLTGYRKMAQRIVDLVYQQLDLDFVPCTSNQIPLVRDPLASAAAVAAYIEELKGRVKDLGLVDYHAWYLATNYGRQTEVLLAKMQSFTDDDPEVALGRAEAWFGVEYEMVASAEDLLVRRTGRLYFEIGSISRMRDVVMKDLKGYLSWSEERFASENQRLDELMYDATHYYELELT
ncbi:MAG: glycerol-3-phosphate dehydrogenase/oxidase [Bacteroidota bacterium]